jgi:dihydrodipicolinate synthase/N-acetylneuraminate lyase
MKSMRMRGINPALPTPFEQDGERLALGLLGPICEWLIGQGVDGLFICGTTGAGPFLTAEEKLEVTREVLRCVDGRAKVILQAAGGDVTGTIRAAREAATLGVDAVSLLMPWYFSCDAEAQYRYARHVAQALDEAPLYLYNIPRMTGNDLDLDTIKRLLDDCPNICGIKESGSRERMLDLLEMQSERFQVVCGIDDHVAEMFEHGMEATVASFGNLCPRQLCGIRDAAQQKAWDEAKRCQQEVCQAVQTFDGPLLIPRIHAAYSLRGGNAGAPRLPLRPLNPQEKNELEASMNKLGLL